MSMHVPLATLPVYSARGKAAKPPGLGVQGALLLHVYFRVVGRAVFHRAE